MMINAPEHKFASRADFRAWLCDNAPMSKGVWLVFSKSKPAGGLSAGEALEEALCFGWIDGQIRKVDDQTYHKYFAPRRPKSLWSEKNRKLVSALREKGLMTALGERAVKAAVDGGTWNAVNDDRVTDAQVEDFAQMLSGISPACENFANMPRSVRVTYARRYLSFKTEQARRRDFERIVDRLKKNLKPM